jgi:uncharacterized secreted repeat protein (TIGR03808 family)
MNFDRRRLVGVFAGVASAASAAPAFAREMPATPVRESAQRASIDAATLGLRPDPAADQSTTLQRAIDDAATARAVLRLGPGEYRAGGLTLPSHAAIEGVPGATRIVLSGGPGLMTATGSDHISLNGLLFDGRNIPPPAQRGLIHITQGRAVRIAGCEIIGAGGNGISLQAVEGEVVGNVVSAGDTAIFSLDALGLRISDNHVRGAGNNGFQVWRTAPGDDGTLVIDNRIENILNRSGGSGQYGNAINVFRADNVIVRSNRIGDAAFSAVRGNAASNLQIVGNTCTRLGEVALYAEFGFEGAVIANNIVDGAAMGVSVTNFNDGGRLAVVQGNLIRNLIDHRPAGTDPNDDAGIGIGVEADSLVNANVIENAPHIGIAAGAGQYLRDVSISANIVRGANYGITVSVAPGAGMSLIADNLISGARLGAVVGTEWKKPVTGDLTKEDATRYAQLSISGNRVR